MKKYLVNLKETHTAQIKFETVGIADTKQAIAEYEIPFIYEKGVRQFRTRKAAINYISVMRKEGANVSEVY